MKIAKKKTRIQTPLIHSIINLERPFERILKKGEYIAIKFHNTPGDMNSGSYEINPPTMEEDHLKSGLSGKTNYSRP